MIVLEVEQGEKEWFDAKLSLPSASRFSEIITTKGVLSDSGVKLMWELVEERFSGVRKKTFESEDTRRGNRLEPEARIFFEMITGIKMDKVGLCYYDERKDRSCSPDGMNQVIREGLEIKCPSLKVHWNYLQTNKLPTTYFTQVQGSMYITGFERWHFFSYYPGMKPLHIIVERDEIWIAKLDKILNEFVEELEETYNQLKESI